MAGLQFLCFAPIGTHDTWVSESKQKLKFIRDFRNQDGVLRMAYITVPNPVQSSGSPTAVWNPSHRHKACRSQLPSISLPWRVSTTHLVPRDIVYHPCISDSFIVLW